MNQHWEDGRIRQLFRELRHKDEQLAPPFIRQWEAAGSGIGAASRFFSFTSPVAATAVLIVLGVFSLILVRNSLLPTPAPGPPQSASIYVWQAPTDFLLNTPGDELVKTVPEIGRSSLQIPAVARKEKSR